MYTSGHNNNQVSCEDDFILIQHMLISTWICISMSMTGLCMDEEETFKKHLQNYNF